MAQQQKPARKGTSLAAKLVVLVLLVLVGIQLLSIREQNRAAEDELSALEGQKLALVQENESLRAALDRADDPEYLQQLAREQYGMVSPGQKDFYDISK